MTVSDYTNTTAREEAVFASASQAEDARTIMLNRISWGAVIAGVVVALVVQLLLGMLGLGIGAATLDPLGGDNPSASTLTISAGIWTVVSGIIASFVGGLMAGRLSGKPVGSTGGLHGLTSWAATTLVIIFLFTTTVGGIVGGLMSGIGGALSGLGQAATAAATVAAPAVANATDPLGTIEEQVRNASGGNDPAALRDAAVSAVSAALTADDAQADTARENAAAALSRAQSIPIEQAREQVAQYEQQYEQAVQAVEQRATEAADVAADAVATGALVGFFSLLLGAIAAWIGGRIGVVHRALFTRVVRPAV